MFPSFPTFLANATAGAKMKKADACFKLTKKKNDIIIYVTEKEASTYKPIWRNGKIASINLKN
jgi:hypothetical protein